MSTRPTASPDPSSEASSPAHSRFASVNSVAIHQHAPLTPSGLRETQTLSVSPEGTRDDHAEASGSECSPRHGPAHGGHIGTESVPNLSTISAEGQETGAGLHTGHNEEDEEAPGAKTSLWGQFGARA